jgi:hypothetical protein
MFGPQSDLAVADLQVPSFPSTPTPSLSPYPPLHPHSLYQHRSLSVPDSCLSSLLGAKHLVYRMASDQIITLTVHMSTIAMLKIISPQPRH